MPSVDLFLSHSSGDAEVARELRAELEAAGYSCWMAPDDVDGTNPWAEQILAAIEGSKAMIVLISANANRSAHVSREVNLALGRKRAVLPIRIENVTPEASLEYLLSLMQRIDAFPPPIASHRDRILRRLVAIVPKPVVPAPAAEVPTEVVPARAEAATAGSAEPRVENLPVPHANAATAHDSTPAPPRPSIGLLAPGTSVGAFTIESLVGEGGMATVYRATQAEPSRRVALKVIRADHAADSSYRQRFLAEKDTLAALEHPSIVPIYAAGDAEGVLYLALRLIDGPDLAAHLRATGPMTAGDAVATLRPIAEAVDYAHEMGIVHRDLKPSNILLDRSRRPYLTDFGLGKQLDKSLGLSAPGIALGTLAYMAPEQFTGIAEPELAGRIDVYALACVAYECMTGRPPFDGATPERLMYAHLHEPLGNQPGISNAVETVLRKALAKNPADRYATAVEFIGALAAAESISEVRTAAIVIPATSQRQRIGAWARANSALSASVVTLATLVVLGSGAVAFWPTADETTRPGGSNAAVSSEDPRQSVAGATDPGPSPSPPPVSAPPTETPTSEPIDEPTPTPSDSRPPPPPPPPDTSPPTGGAIALSGSIDKSLTTNRTITVSITARPKDSSGICGRATTNNNSRPGAGSSSWRSYSGGLISFKHTLPDGNDGSRTVYVWFRDCAAARNVSTSARTDSIKFDHAPRIFSGVTFTGNSCNTTYHLDLLGDPDNPIATDRDGGLRVIRLWTGGKNYPGTDNLSNHLSDNGRSANIPVSGVTTSHTFKDWFTVEDSYGVRRTGWFYFKVNC